MTHLEAIRIYYSIPVEERRRLKTILDNEKEEEKTEKMMHYVNVMKKMTGIDVTSKGRTRDVVDARAVVSYVLHENGFREYAIGRALNKDHSMVHTYIDEIRFFLRIKIEDDRIKLLNEYKNRLEYYETNRRTI